MTARTAIALLLFASGTLFLLGIDWGLPSTHTWHGDSMCHTTLRAMGARFAGFTKYPPVHHVILALAYAPYIGWLFLRGELDLHAGSMEQAFQDPVTSMTVLIVLTRLVGVAMAVGTVALVVRIVQRLGGDTGAALIAGALFALSSEVGFFAKLAMVDGPMVFWFAAGLATLIELPGKWRPRTGTLLGCLVALGMCTKEQIAGAWVLPPWILIALALRHSKKEDSVSPYPALLAGFIAWVFTYGVASKFFIDPAGWTERMRAWLGESTSAEVWGGHPNSIAGQVMVLRDTGWELLNAMGPALLILALGLGLVALLRRPPGTWLVATSLLSYYLFTLASLRYVKTRFTLPMVLLLAILAGLGLASWPRGGLRRLGLGAAGLLLAFGFVRCLRVVELMASDPRTKVEAFLAESVTPGTQVEVYADDQYLPRLALADLQPVHVSPGDMTPAGLEQRAPHAIVLAPAYHWKLRPAARSYMQWLQEQAGYQVHTFEGGQRPMFLSDDTATVLLPTIHVLLR